MKLIVIRHETTVLNEKGLINGRLEDELSENGKKDLINLIDKLKGFKFTKIYSSPLHRALETAKPIAKDHNNIEILKDERLIEVDFGSFTGKPWDSTASYFHQGNSSEMLNTYNYDFSKFGGESFEDVKKRTYSFLDDLKKIDDNEILIVTHGGVIRWLYLHLKNQKVKTFPNGSIHFFEL
jgi:alpha-ribazole phosphatase